MKKAFSLPLILLTMARIQAAVTIPRLLSLLAILVIVRGAEGGSISGSGEHCQPILSLDIVSPTTYHEASSAPGSNYPVDISVTASGDGTCLRAQQSLIRYCLYVNGTRHGECVGSSASNTSPPVEEDGLTLHATGLAPGLAWLHVEAQTTTGGDAPQTLAASRLVPVRVTGSGLLPATPPTHQAQRVTLALNLVLQDVPRALLLFSSLSRFVDPSAVSTLLLIAPDSQAWVLRQLVHACPFPCHVIPESALLGQPKPQHWDSYAVQMALKLLVSRVVETEFYVTLDADVLAAGAVTHRDLVTAEEGRAVFVDESRGVHPHWWEGSARLLDYDHDDGGKGGFGVTPAVLSTGGALVVLARLREVGGEAWAEHWIGGWADGQWWSEYTAYRLVLDRRRLFHRHHVDKQGTHLICPTSKWFSDGVGWDPRPSLEAGRQRRCLFVVVQSSSTDVRPQDLSASLQPFLEQHPPPPPLSEAE